MKPSTIPEACRHLVGGISYDRAEAQRDLGADMLDALVSKGLALHKGGRYAASDAGRRAAREAEPVSTVEAG